MAKSKEYPDLNWVPAKAFGRGRDGKAVRYIVIHYTAGSERATSAEDGAAYDQRRTDGTSTHYFVDRDSVVQCVETDDRANAARHRGNRLGIQYELCGTAQTRAQWLDAASKPTLLNAAKQVARDCRKYGIPVRRLSVSETRAAWTDFPRGPKGIVGHVDCTKAYPEDGGDHTDPGEDFPWNIFLEMVRDEMEEDDGMAGITQTDFNARMDAWWETRMDSPPRTTLKVSPWQQEVGRTGESTHNVLFGTMKGLLESTASNLQALSTAFAAFVAREGIEDAATDAALTALQTSVLRVQETLDDVPPVDAADGPSIG